MARLNFTLLSPGLLSLSYLHLVLRWYSSSEEIHYRRRFPDQTPSCYLKTSWRSFERKNQSFKETDVKQISNFCLSSNNAQKHKASLRFVNVPLLLKRRQGIIYWPQFTKCAIFVTFLVFTLLLRRPTVPHISNRENTNRDNKKPFGLKDNSKQTRGLC